LIVINDHAAPSFAMQSEPPQPERHCELRDPVALRVGAFGGDARAFEMQVTNLSPHGLTARCTRERMSGERLRLILPEVGVVAAEVRWTLGEQFGLCFDMPIDRATYYELIAATLAQPERSSPTAASRSNR